METIDRKAAVERVSQMTSDPDFQWRLRDTLRRLPTIGARPEGEWEWTDGIPVGYWVCSECGGWRMAKTRFCPDCGAWMGGRG